MSSESAPAIFMHCLEIADLSDCDKIHRCIAPRFKDIPTIPLKRQIKQLFLC